MIDQTPGAQVVLVIEDDPVIGDQLRTALMAAGYRARLAGNGRTALDMLGSPVPALVLLDLGLPDLDGLELCRLLRARLPDAVIIALTARHDEIDVIAGLESGADDYLFKPFKLSSSGIQEIDALAIALIDADLRVHEELVRERDLASSSGGENLRSNEAVRSR